MSESHTNGAMVSFENLVLGSASDEFAAVDPDIQEAFFRHLGKIVSGKKNHWTLREFASYGRVPIYKAEVDRWIMIYAVEEQALGDRKVSVMFCGRFGTRCNAGGFAWDGSDLDALRERLVLVRAAAWFF